MYTVKKIHGLPELRGAWDGPVWITAETLELTHFRIEGSGHRPRTQARLLYGNAGIRGFILRDSSNPYVSVIQM